MSHIIVITTPPADGGGGSRVAPSGVKVSIEYAPSHDLSAEQQHANIEKIERLSGRFYEKLVAKLAGEPE